MAELKCPHCGQAFTVDDTELSSIVQQIRDKEFEKDIPAVYDMLKKGCEVAREAAAQTMDEVRRAMKINYFEDAALIEEQAKRFSEQ